MLTQDYLKSILDYNPETGLFFWRHRSNVPEAWNIKNANKIAGTLDLSTGYIRIGALKKLWRAHRLAWLYIHGHFPKNQIDHINGIRIDNRINNLREATNSENQQNKRHINSCNFLGVRLHKSTKKYQARISINNKRISLGYFNTPEEAQEAYLKAKQKFHPFNTL